MVVRKARLGLYGGWPIICFKQNSSIRFWVIPAERGCVLSWSITIPSLSISRLLYWILRNYLNNFKQTLTYLNTTQSGHNDVSGKSMNQYATRKCDKKANRYLLSGNQPCIWFVYFEIIFHLSWNYKMMIIIFHNIFNYIEKMDALK